MGKADVKDFDLKGETWRKTGQIDDSKLLVVKINTITSLSSKKEWAVHRISHEIEILQPMKKKDEKAM